MTLFVDLIGYLSIISHALAIVSQSIALGSAVFLAGLARPLAEDLGSSGPCVTRVTARVGSWSAICLVIFAGVTLALQSALLAGTTDLTLGSVFTAQFAISDMAKIACALLLILALRTRDAAAAPTWLLLAIVSATLAAATLTSHAAARLEHRGVLLTADGLHQLGAAAWVGGIPCFLFALALASDGRVRAMISERFSRIAAVGAATIFLSGVFMSLFYIGSWQGLYGTAYGVMVATKLALFLMLLGLGAGNFVLVRRLRRVPDLSITRLRRFAEVELGLGFAAFFAAASLTSAPPAIDLAGDHGGPVAWRLIVARQIPHWPRLVSPNHGALALPALLHALDEEAARSGTEPEPVFVPGSGELPPRNAADIAWSEYNHHWSGILLLAIGAASLLSQAGLRWAAHWPLLLIGLAAFLVIRADPEVWPLGTEGLIASLRDVEVLQHRVLVLLLVVFGLSEWRLRRAERRRCPTALVFPLVSALGGILLLTHNHAGGSAQEQLMLELAQLPIALLAVVAASSRWLELRLHYPAARTVGWVWPVCFVLIGFLLLLYRET